MNRNIGLLRRKRLYALLGACVLLVSILIAGAMGLMPGSNSDDLPPTIPAGIQGGEDFFSGTLSLEERILGSEAIVRARLQSVDDAVNYVVPPEGAGYVNSLEFTFRVLEYLKGSGGNEIVGVVPDMDHIFATEAEAEASESQKLSNRDTSWDGREAILFLSDNNRHFDTSDQSDRYWLGEVSGYRDHYTVGSRLWRAWLPDATGQELPGSDSQRSGSTSQRFLLEEPNVNSATRVARSGGATSLPETMSLSDLKTLVSQIEAEVSAGDDTNEYRRCVQTKYALQRQVDYRKSRMGGEYYYHRTDQETMSGMPAQTEVYVSPSSTYLLLEAFGETAPEVWGELYLGGKDRSLFTGTYPGNVLAVRPLATGVYEFSYIGRSALLMLCDALPPQDEIDRLGVFLTVTPPTGTLDEAFFDPVALSGGAIGATGSSGVIDPDEFTVSSDDYEIESLIWRNNSVVLTLDDHVSLSGYSLDFLELDGSIDTTLDVSDATVNQTAATWTWSVTGAPWDDGDLLMLRIRDTSTGPTVVTLTIHQPTRLRIMTLLAAQPKEGRVAYGFIQGNLGLTGGNLTIHLRKLEEAGYVAMSKEFIGAKPRT